MTTFLFLTHPTPTQAAQILSLYEAAGWWRPDPEAPKLLLRLIAGSHCFLVAEAKGDIIGMGRAISDGVSDAYIQDVTVRPDFKKLGIGSRIVTKIAERLKKDGLTWVGLIAERHSHPFYQRIGFFEMPDAIPMRLKI
ncbi:MAG: GNAT family N-acetyltransferase [Desulfobacterales bacterium]|jgi:spermidine synthase|nr:GNAT family N-acetyltransferase [Desulfobacterales bacterium]